MSTVKKSVIYSLIAAIITIGGIGLTNNPLVPVKAQTDEEEGRQADLREWQEQIQQWQQQQTQNSMQTTDLSSQGVVQLPNTGPSN